MNQFLQKVRGLFGAIRLSVGYIRGTSASHQACTEEYPDKISARVAGDLASRSRGFLANDLEKCTGCGDCLEVCTSRALSMDANINVDGSVRVNRFRIDLGKCYSCAACVEICPVNSLKHTKGFEVRAFEPSDLILEFDGRLERIGASQERIREKIKMIRAYEVRR